MVVRVRVRVIRKIVSSGEWVVEGDADGGEGVNASVDLLLWCGGIDDKWCW